MQQIDISKCSTDELKAFTFDRQEEMANLEKVIQACRGQLANRRRAAQEQAEAEQKANVLPSSVTDALVDRVVAAIETRTAKRTPEEEAAKAAS
jgi:hypothetical protein